MLSLSGEFRASQVEPLGRDDNRTTDDSYDKCLVNCCQSYNYPRVSSESRTMICLQTDQSVLQLVSYFLGSKPKKKKQYRKFGTRKQLKVLANYDL